MDKPFKGVISNWRLSGNRICGTCVFHTTYDNGIARDEPITTSNVVTIYKSPQHGCYIAETKNSLYVLV